MSNKLVSIVSLALLAACSSSAESGKTDAQFAEDVTTGIHATLQADVDALAASATELRDAAPTPSGRGWDTTADAEAVEKMTEAWLKARSAYERIEGAIAPLFPETDFAIDARYDDYLTKLGGTGDPDLFDDEGVTGMHAIERILFTEKAPAYVAEFEKRTLPGYAPSRFPNSEAEAAAFKTKLCAKLVADTAKLKAEWTPVKVDVAAAFQGLVALVNEQQEKVNKASTQEEESRYAQRTLADLRDNLAGVERAYAVFKPWVRARTRKGIDGAAADAAIDTGIKRLRDLYASYAGDRVPLPPTSWSATNPSEADLASDFGRLYAGVRKEVDPNEADSIVARMNDVAKLLGFAEFVEGQ